MTRVLRTRAELRAVLDRVSQPVGLVPTMGWLHDGHRSLMRRARAEDATTVVSIFVNPRQFGDPADLARYPRSEARDLAICEEEGVDLVWAPPADEVYPPGFDTTVAVGAIAHPLEGTARPGHFDGVATVVAILFALEMARDLALPTAVIACPTVREPDGLALSSRNVHLSPTQRAAAPVLHHALVGARDAHTAGERSADTLRALMRTVLAAEPLADVDYVSVADGDTLTELERVDGPALLSLAVRFGATRLIDNEPIGG
jgi:pantoate--beta-alanine ligase